MEGLIEVINEIHDVLKKNKITAKEIQLPRFVVVGEQSAGKSSLLETLVKREFFPTGEDMVTRAPLELRLFNMPEGDDKRPEKHGSKVKGEYAIFEHKTEHIFENFREVCIEIERRTDELTSKRRDICEEPICLNIYSAKVVNLTLVDLPGLVQNPTPDQPEDIEEKIQRLVDKYIKEEKTLILVVTKANNELQTSIALKAARRVDPSLKRTLVVLTHVDRVEAMYDLEGMLLGKKIPVKNGIVGVKLRSKQEKSAGKSIEDCIKIEANFWNKYPKSIANKNGIKFLSHRLNQLLMEHIRDNLPQLRQLIREKIKQTESELGDLEEPVDDADKNLTCAEILKEFSNNFELALEGDGEANRFGGGARILHVFEKIFVPALEKVVSIEMPTDQILNVIKNIAGYNDPIFILEVAYRKLVSASITKLKSESLECTEKIYDELLNIVKECYDKVYQKYRRYPVICEKAHEVMTTLIMDQKKPTKKFLGDLVRIMSGYINKNSPGFMTEELKKFIADPMKTHDVFIKKFIQDLNFVKMEVEGDEEDSFKDRELKFILENSNKQITSIPSDPNLEDDGESYSEHLTYVPPEDRVYGHGSASVASIITANNNSDLNKNSLSEKERKDLVLTVGLVDAYFKLVKRTFQDVVPKTIIELLVTHVRENVHTTLLNKCMHEGEFNDLLQNVAYLLMEDPFVVKQRQEKQEALEGYTSALEVFNKLREYQVDKTEETDGNLALVLNGDPDGLLKRRRVSNDINSDF